jgi:hypothetical protein
MSLVNRARELEKHDIDEQDVKRIAGYDIPVYRYHQLSRFNTLDGALGNTKSMVVLYQTTKWYGHFVLVMKQNGVTEFFDSYGFKMDEELPFASYNLRLHRGQAVPHLSHLIQADGSKVINNNVRLQEFAHQISTCGRWVAWRARLRHMSLREFQVLMGSNKYYKPDMYVSMVTMFI